MNCIRKKNYLFIIVFVTDVFQQVATGMFQQDVSVNLAYQFLAIEPLDFVEIFQEHS